MAQFPYNNRQTPQPVQIEEYKATNWLDNKKKKNRRFAAGKPNSQSF